MSRLSLLSLSSCLVALTGLIAAMGVSPALATEEKTPLVIHTMSQSGYTAKFNLKSAERSGICLDILHAIEKQNPEIKFTGLTDLGSMARSFEEVKDGKIDMFCGVAKVPERIGKLIIDEPALYAQSFKFVARADDPVVIHSFDDIRNLGDKGLILSMSGNSQSIFLRRQPGLLIDEGSKSPGDNLKKLLLGRGRFFFSTDIAAIDETRKLKIEKQVKFMPMEFEPERVLAAFNLQAPPEMVERFQAALKRLERSGELKRIQNKYLKSGR